MKKKLELVGNTVEEKIDHIERILRSFRMRLGKRVVGVIPPTVIPAYSPFPSKTGRLMFCVFPAYGKVVKGAIAVGKYNSKKTVRFSCNLTGPNHSLHRRFDTRRPVEIFDLDMEVSPGDVMYLEVLDTCDEGHIVEDVYVSVLYHVSVPDSYTKEFLIEDFLRSLDEGV